MSISVEPYLPDPRGRKGRLAQQALAGIAIFSATVAIVYLSAIALSSRMTAKFSTAESNRHLHLSEFSGAMQQASLAFGTARTRCELFINAEKTDCDDAAAIEELRARLDARLRYRNSRAQAAVASMAAPSARSLDMALYLAHRQLP